MEWLLGALVGGAIGLGSALVATEYTTWRDRTIRANNMARSLRTEIASTKPLLQEVHRAVAEATAQDMPGTALIRPLASDAFKSCVGELGLLPKGTREAVQIYYNNLAGIEYIMSEAYMLYKGYPPHFEKPVGEALRPLHTWLEGGAKATLQAAEEAIAALDKIAAERGSWWQRIVGR